MIADVCHRLPVSPLGRDKEGFDPFVYMWQTASPDQQRWLTEQLQAIGVDQRYLEESPPWPPPATPPAVRPRWGRHGWQLPRDPRAFQALDTTTLRALILEADALEPPGRKHPNWLLAHLHPDGPHILRVSRTDEILFLPQGRRTCVSTVVSSGWRTAPRSSAMSGCGRPALPPCQPT